MGTGPSGVFQRLHSSLANPEKPVFRFVVTFRQQRAVSPDGQIEPVWLGTTRTAPPWSRSFG